MRFYVCDLIGAGTEDDPFRPAAALYVRTWTAVDGRADPTVGDGAMLVACDPTPEQHAAMIADPRIDHLADGGALGGAAAKALARAGVAAGRGDNPAEAVRAAFLARQKDFRKANGR